MFRLFKLFKNNKRSYVAKSKNMLIGSTGINRLFFFLFLVILLNHFIGCMWIFIGRTFSEDEAEDNHSWINASGFENLGIMQLYVAAYYYVMQTLTTVGYGDIVMVKLSERIMSIFILFIGVIVFSFISGSLTNIIANHEKNRSRNYEK